MTLFPTLFSTPKIIFTISSNMNEVIRWSKQLNRSKLEQFLICAWQQVGSYYYYTNWCPCTKAWLGIQPTIITTMKGLQWKTSTQTMINKGLSTNPIDAILSSTPRHSFTNTTIKHKCNFIKLIQDVSLLDLSYWQNKWEETPEMIQYVLILMGFDCDQICMPVNLDIC